MRLSAISRGGVITELLVPSASGARVDVVLGLENLTEYRDRPSFLGAIIGRYGNRIRDGRFELDGREYRLATNDPPNHLHGGESGFDVGVWSIHEVSSDEGAALDLTLSSPDNDEGYPGELEVRVRYTLTDDNALVIDYEARTNRPTHVNLTQHSYFNLGGHDSGSVLDHEVRILADAFTPTDSSQIPTGEIASVANTPMDFRERRRLGDRIDADHPQMTIGYGYDHNYVLRRDGLPFDALVHAASVRHPETRITMDVLTTEPGLQFYSGNHLNGLPGKNNAVYGPRTGFCLETQHYPDSPNQPHFPSTVLRPGETYRSRTVYRFSTAPD